MNKQKEFYKTYKDIPPSVLAMIWVDIEEMLDERTEEVIKEINKLKKL